MTQWWNELTLLGQILSCIAIPSTLVLLIQTVLTLIGASHSTDFDVDGQTDIDTGDVPDDGVFESTDADTESIDAGFRILSLRSIIAFFAVFGWVGLILEKNNTGSFITIPVSIISGFIAMLIVALLFRWIIKLQSDGTQSIKNALGVSGTVYLKILPQRLGKGKVSLILQGSLTELDAVTDEENVIPYGSEIVVIAISGSNTVVVKRK